MSYNVKTKTPNTAIEWYDSGVDDMLTNKFKEALTAFNQAIKLQPNFIECYLKKALLLSNLSQDNKSKNKMGETGRSFKSFKRQSVK